MPRLDIMRNNIHLYDPSTKEVQFITIPQFHYLMVSGEGDPNVNDDFDQAIEALYTVSHALRNALKDRQDFYVMPLEGLWWTNDQSEFSMDCRDQWKWTLMIMQPDFINQQLVREAITMACSKKSLVMAPKLRFELWAEGLVAQILHKGAYGAEGPTIEKLHAVIHEKGYARNGKHHEIYLNDPRVDIGDRAKTIIRQPIA